MNASSYDIWYGRHNHQRALKGFVEAGFAVVMVSEYMPDGNFYSEDKHCSGGAYNAILLTLGKGPCLGRIISYKTSRVYSKMFYGTTSELVNLEAMRASLDLLAQF